MLNQPLADAFRKTNAGRMTGAIKVTHGGVLRFYFEEGELLLLDFCEDKELLLARQFRAYHKIGQGEMVVTQQWQTSQVRVGDYLSSQQLANAEEVAAVTRSLVEDALCDCFGYPLMAGMGRFGHRRCFDTDVTAVKLQSRSICWCAWLNHASTSEIAYDKKSPTGEAFLA